MSDSMSVCGQSGCAVACHSILTILHVHGVWKALSCLATL